MSEQGSFPQASAQLRPYDLAPGPEEPDPDVRFNWRVNAGLFLATVASVFFLGRFWTAREGMSAAQEWLGAWVYAVPLLVILVCHEFGHYIAARIHRVPASLPYFLPLPILNPFGTLGAVILMPGRIRSRKALLDIGAAGPLAGMAVALPLMLYGLSLSHVAPISSDSHIQEGQSLLYWALKRIMFGPIPAGHDVYIHPTALAAWVGFMVTFLNLLPVGQLDGGHVAYALLGKHQHRIARWFMFTPLILLIYNAVIFGGPIVIGLLNDVDRSTLHFNPLASLVNWVTLGLLLLALRRWVGIEHPPVDDEELGWGRKLVAGFTLALFILLFMPSPWVVY